VLEAVQIQTAFSLNFAVVFLSCLKLSLVRMKMMIFRLYKPAFELAASIDLARARVSRRSGTAIAVAADVPGVPALVAVERELVQTNFHSPTATSWTLAEAIQQPLLSFPFPRQLCCLIMARKGMNSY
jgi:hypothetical protein